jgi:hypothetical protein
MYRGITIVAQSIYAQAMAVQDACNPRGVLKSFAEEIMPGIVAEVEAETGYASTDDILRHPAYVLFASKLDSLALRDFGSAYAAAKEKAS